MGDNEREDSTEQVDDQGTSEAEVTDEQRAAAKRRRVERAQGLTSAVAPVDDDVIIK